MTNNTQLTEVRFNNRAGLPLFKLFLKELLQTGIDLVFPPRCANCGRADHIWCGHCQAELDASPLEIYPRNLDGLEIVSTGKHKGLLQRAVQALKYENTKILCDPLGNRLARAMMDLDWPIELVVPVAMHPERLAARGYNQAGLIAASFAQIQNLPYSDTAIQRIRSTQSQVELNQQERLKNVQGAFLGDATLLAERTVLVVDDVCTTGATLLACAQAAYEAGATKVFALTVTAA